MNRFQYYFEEVEVTVPDGSKRYAEGTIEVEYNMNPAEPDIGIPTKYAEVNQYLGGKIILSDMEDDTITRSLSRDEPRELEGELFDQIEAAQSEDILRACEDDAEERWERDIYEREASFDARWKERREERAQED